MNSMPNQWKILLKDFGEKSMFRLNTVNFQISYVRHLFMNFAEIVEFKQKMPQSKNLKILMLLHQHHGQWFMALLEVHVGESFSKWLIIGVGTVLKWWSWHSYNLFMLEQEWSVGQSDVGDTDDKLSTTSLRLKMSPILKIVIIIFS